MNTGGNQQRVKKQEGLIGVAKIFIALLVFSEPHLQSLRWRGRRQGATGRETANHSYSQCDRTLHGGWGWGQAGPDTDLALKIC